MYEFVVLWMWLYFFLLVFFFSTNLVGNCGDCSWGTEVVVLGLVLWPRRLLLGRVVEPPLLLTPDEVEENIWIVTTPPVMFNSFMAVSWPAMFTTRGRLFWQVIVFHSTRFDPTFFHSISTQIDTEILKETLTVKLLHLCCWQMSWFHRWQERQPAGIVVSSLSKVS